MVIIVLIRMRDAQHRQRPPITGNLGADFVGGGLGFFCFFLILFCFSCGLWKGITTSEQQEQISAHHIASSPKQPQEINRVSEGKRKARKRGAKPSRGKTEAMEGASQSLAQHLLLMVQSVFL